MECKLAHSAMGFVYLQFDGVKKLHALRLLTSNCRFAISIPHIQAAHCILDWPSFLSLQSLT